MKYSWEIILNSIWDWNYIFSLIFQLDFIPFDKFVSHTIFTFGLVVYGYFFMNTVVLLINCQFIYSICCCQSLYSIRLCMLQKVIYYCLLFTIVVCPFSTVNIKIEKLSSVLTGLRLNFLWRHIYGLFIKGWNFFPIPWKIIGFHLLFFSMNNSIDVYYYASIAFTK